MRKLSIAIVALFIFSTSTSFGQTSSDDSFGQKKGRPDVPGTLLIEVGLGVLQDAPSTMDMSVFGSRTVNLYYFYNMPIGSSNFEFRPGFGLGMDRYKFDNDVTLTQSVNGTGDTEVSVTDITDVDLKKSMLITNYFDIPLEFMFFANPADKKRSFKVAVGGRGGMRFSSHTKVKYEQNGDKVKEKGKREFELNRFRYGVTGRIGVGGFSVFYYQNLSNMFDGNGPEGTDDMTNITIGLSFAGF